MIAIDHITVRPGLLRPLQHVGCLCAGRDAQTQPAVRRIHSNLAIRTGTVILLIFLRFLCLILLTGVIDHRIIRKMSRCEHQLAVFILCLVACYISTFCHVYHMIIAGVFSCLRCKVDGNDCFSTLEIMDTLSVTGEVCLEGRCHLMLIQRSLLGAVQFPAILILHNELYLRAFCLLCQSFQCLMIQFDRCFGKLNGGCIDAVILLCGCLCQCFHRFLT